MENKPNISFIPRKPISSDTNQRNVRPASLSFMLAIVLLFGTLGAYGGLYYYEKTLSADITEKQKEIIDINTGFDFGIITEGKAFQRKVEIAENILKNHVSPVLLFKAIADKTLKSVQLENVSYNVSETLPTLTVSGTAPGYASVAVQRDAFIGADAHFTGVSLDKITLTDTGKVSFTLSMTVHPEQFSFDKKNQEKSNNANAIMDLFESAGSNANDIIITQ